MGIAFGALGHSWLHGGAPGIGMLVALLVGSTACAAPLGHRRISARMHVGLLVALQVAVHISFLVTPRTTLDAGVHAHAHGHGHAHGTMDGMSADATHSADSGMLALMFAAHLLAVLVGVLVLQRIERRAWSAATRVAGLIARALVRPAPLACVPRSISAPRRHSLDSVPRSRWHVIVTGRRGPPLRPHAA